MTKTDRTVLTFAGFLLVGSLGNMLGLDPIVVMLKLSMFAIGVSVVFGLVMRLSR